MPISYSVAICSMWSLSSLYCSGRENRVIPEEMAFRSGLARSVHRSDRRLLAVTSTLYVSRNKHTKVDICSQGHGFYRDGVMCGVWPRVAKSMLSSGDHPERVMTLRSPKAANALMLTVSAPGWGRGQDRVVCHQNTGLSIRPRRSKQ